MYVYYLLFLVPYFILHSLKMVFLYVARVVFETIFTKWEKFETPNEHGSTKHETAPHMVTIFIA